MEGAKTLYKYWALAVVGYKKRLSYRAAIPNLILLYLLGYIITFFFWGFVHDAGDIQGFSLSDTFTYLFVASLVRTFVNNDLDRILSRKIRQGLFACDILLPANPVGVSVAESMGTTLYMLMWGALPVALTVGWFFPLTRPSLGYLMAFCITVAVAIVLNVQINFIVGLISVWTRRIDGVMALKGIATLILAGTLVPLDFLPGWILSVLKVTPFAALSYYPAMVFLEKMPPQELAMLLLLQVVWAIVLLSISRRVFTRARIKLVTFGG